MKCESKPNFPYRETRYCVSCGMPLNNGSRFCSKCGLPVVSSKKAPKLNSLIFWFLWAALALLCALVALGEFSLLRLVCFGIIAALPPLFRKKLFVKPVLSAILWPAAFILLFIAAAATDMSGNTERTAAWKTVLSSDGVMVSMLEGALPEGSDIALKKERYAYAKSGQHSPGTENTVFSIFDIILPQGGLIDGIAEIRLPIDRKLLPQSVNLPEAVSAAYFNESSNLWEPVPYSIDESKGMVNIFTDHFSKYAVVYFKSGRKVLSERIPEFDSLPVDFFSSSELDNIVNEMGSGSESLPSALSAGWNRFSSYYGLAGAVGTIMGEGIESSTLEHVNSLMAEAGAGFAFAQLALDIYSGDNKAAVNNFVKNASAYSASKWGGRAVNLASAGVAFMDYAINQYAEKALEKNLQKWEDAYRKYYSSNAKVRRSAVDWYNIVRRLHAESAGPEDFKAKIDSEITAYCDLFWKDAEGYAYVAESTPGLRGFGAGGEFAAGVDKISGNYRQFIYKTTMKTVMEIYVKNLCIQEYKKADAAYDKLKQELNKTHVISVILNNYDKVKNASNAKVRFINASGEVLHSQGLDGGRAELHITLFGFLKAGGGLKAEIIVAAQGNTPEYRAVFPIKLSAQGTEIRAEYAPDANDEISEAISNKAPSKAKTGNNGIPATKPYVQKRQQPDGSNNSTDKIPSDAGASKTDGAGSGRQNADQVAEYDYNAALAAWAADFAAGVNSNVYDDGKCISTPEFEWVAGPMIKDGQVIGASRIWRTDEYYDGPRKGETVRYISNEAFDANNPGVYISVDELKKSYPRFLK